MDFLFSGINHVQNLIGAENFLLFEIASILVLASILGIILRILKQPLILAYLITGLIIGYFGFFDLGDREALDFFSNLGVIFLLFLVGLEMDYNSIKKIGKTALFIGLGQVFFTAMGGFIVSYFIFGFEMIHSTYIAIALTFSSTVIIVKLLSDKGSLNSLHGRAAIGLLLVQDIVVILILIGLNAIDAGSEFGIFSMASILLGGIFLFALMFYLGRSVFPYIFKKISHSQELLFLVSLAWLLFFSVVVKMAGFSIEIAGFLGGVALANSSQKFNIASKIQPLRDFFILIFFAILGSLMVISDFSGIILPVVFFSLFVLIGNPLIVMIIMRFLGYKKRTNFLTGVTVAQISEFSMIFATLGLSMGHISDQIFAIIAAVGVITITVSTYLILHAEDIFLKISGVLSIFEKKKTIEDKESDVGRSKPIILVGAHRTGRSIINCINPEKLLVIDFDPMITDCLKKKGINHLFSDITDPHLFDNLDLSQTKLIISTSPNLKDNLSLIEKMELKNLKIIVRADDEVDAKMLYDFGADYVLLPHFISGQYLGSIIDYDFELLQLEKLKERDLRIISKLD